MTKAVFTGACLCQVWFLVPTKTLRRKCCNFPAWQIGKQGLKHLEDCGRNSGWWDPSHPPASLPDLCASLHRLIQAPVRGGCSPTCQPAQSGKVKSKGRVLSVFVFPWRTQGIMFTYTPHSRVVQPGTAVKNCEASHRFYPTRQPASEPALVSWRLAEDTRLLGQRQQSSLLTEVVEPE
jgi:hypothetical protein